MWNEKKNLFIKFHCFPEKPKFRNYFFFMNPKMSVFIGNLSIK